VGRSGRVGEEQVVGRGHGGDRQAGRLRAPDHGDRPGRRQVQGVHRGAGQPAGRGVPHGHQLLGLRRLGGDAEANRPLPLVDVAAGRQGVPENLELRALEETGQVHQRVLRLDQLQFLEATPEREPFDKNRNQKHEFAGREHGSESGKQCGEGRERIADGYVGLIEDGNARVVADNFFGTNEIRLDPDEEWLYVVETPGSRISRLRVHSDGSLTDREIYGPANLGGRPDGMTFDAYGNLWITLVSHDRLIALTPEGDVLPIWGDGDPAAKDRRDRAEREGTATPALLESARGRLAPRMASVTFGGQDLSTVYSGSLLGTTLPTFRTPVPGQPMVHWNEDWST